MSMTYLRDRTPSHYVINYLAMRTLMSGVYKLFLNITIQHVCLWLNNGISSTFKEFEMDIDEIFGPINAYILQLITRSDTPSRHEKHWIFGAAFTVISGLVSAYIFYKSYTLKRTSKGHCTTFLMNKVISVKAFCQIKEICFH